MTSNAEDQLRIKADAAEIDLSPTLAGIRVDIDRGMKVKVPRHIDLDLDSKPQRLVWRPCGGWKDGPTVSGCLNAYLKLAHDPAPERILEFARTYGVLGICSHGIPGTHNDCYPVGMPVPYVESIPSESESKDPAPPAESSLPDVPFELTNVEAWEEIDKWRWFTGQGRDLLVVASDLLTGIVPKEESWERVPKYGAFARQAREIEPPVKDHVPWQMGLVTEMATEWLGMANIRPSCVWTDNPKRRDGEDERMPVPQLTIALDAEPAVTTTDENSYAWPRVSLFRVLALQLAAAITSARGSYACSWCGVQFVPENRRRPSGKRIYCDEHAYKRKADWWNMNRSVSSRKSEG